MKDGCADVSSVLGSAVSQVRPHFPRFLAVAAFFQTFPWFEFCKKRFSYKFDILYCNILVILDAEDISVLKYVIRESLTCPPAWWGVATRPGRARMSRSLPRHCWQWRYHPRWRRLGTRVIEGKFSNWGRVIALERTASGSPSQPMEDLQTYERGFFSSDCHRFVRLL